MNIASNGIGQNLRTLRENYNMTQKELADTLNVSQTAVALWEKGVREPRLGQLRQIADALGVTLSDLTGEGTSETYFEAERQKIGQKYKKIREELGILQEQLANKTGFSVADIENAEQGFFTAKTPDDIYKRLDDIFAQCIEDKKHAARVGIFEPKDAVEKNPFRSDFKRMQEEFDTDIRNYLILNFFLMLNNSGKREAVKRMSELTKLKEYTEPDTPPDQPDPVDPDDPDQ